MDDLMIIIFVIAWYFLVAMNVYPANNKHRTANMICASISIGLFAVVAFLRMVL